MRVILIGATGTIGRKVAKALQAENFGSLFTDIPLLDPCQLPSPSLRAMLDPWQTKSMGL